MRVDSHLPVALGIALVVASPVIAMGIQSIGDSEKLGEAPVSHTIQTAGHQTRALCTPYGSGALIPRCSDPFTPTFATVTEPFHEIVVAGGLSGPDRIVVLNPRNLSVVGETTANCTIDNMAYPGVGEFILFECELVDGSRQILKYDLFKAAIVSAIQLPPGLSCPQNMVYSQLRDSLICGTGEPGVALRLEFPVQLADRTFHFPGLQPESPLLSYGDTIVYEDLGNRSLRFVDTLTWKVVSSGDLSEVVDQLGFDPSSGLLYAAGNNVTILRWTDLSVVSRVPVHSPEGLLDWGVPISDFSHGQIYFHVAQDDLLVFDTKHDGFVGVIRAPYSTYPEAYLPDRDAIVSCEDGFAIDLLNLSRIDSSSAAFSETPIVGSFLPAAAGIAVGLVGVGLALSPLRRRHPPTTAGPTRSHAPPRGSAADVFPKESDGPK